MAWFIYNSTYFNIVRLGTEPMSDGICPHIPVACPKSGRIVVKYKWSNIMAKNWREASPSDIAGVWGEIPSATPSKRRPFESVSAAAAAPAAQWPNKYLFDLLVKWLLVKWLLVKWLLVKWWASRSASSRKRVGNPRRQPCLTTIWPLFWQLFWPLLTTIFDHF